MATVDENQLIEAARGGDLEAFNQLVLMYQGQVYALAYHLLGDANSAADLTQDTFLSAFQHIDRFEKGSLRAWLLRIVANMCYDLLRRQRIHPFSPLEILLPRSETGEPKHATELGDDPEEYVERRELAQEIQKALNTLLPEQRLAVILCDLQGLAYEEAAHASAVSLGTLKSRLSRGRARLRRYFLEHQELLPTSLRSILGEQNDRPVETAEGLADE